MKMMAKRAAVLAVAACVSSCGAVQRRDLAEVAPIDPARITVAAGPCFGSCPVYEVSLDESGRVLYVGREHTAIVGNRERQIGRKAYQRLARDLAPFRPADGTTAPVDCEVAISDTTSYTVSWVDGRGRAAAAVHRRGCPRGAGHRLDEVLRDLPARLGIEEWARQASPYRQPRA